MSICRRTFLPLRFIRNRARWYSAFNDREDQPPVRAAVQPADQQPAVRAADQQPAVRPAVQPHRFPSLLKSVLTGRTEIPEYYKRLIEEKRLGRGLKGPSQITFQLLNWSLGDAAAPGSLEEANKLFKQRFKPIYGSHGEDLVENMILGTSGEEFKDMLCAVLLLDGTVASTALFRLIGPKVAEMPLAASSFDFEGQAVFRCLFDMIVNQLTSLKVTTLIIPSCEITKEFWRDRYGFSIVSEEEKLFYRESYNMTEFGETVLMHKKL
ncbi:uncharacterized protein LOC130726386 [Lotus japonicus]|uniref:uncharacterized protein LOC130726386 n=1 Tax=Lotus japonicus TaxID=34305 RepID=UPI00258BD65C|nr:uncharacterized protein LOC130726386 [Lotus japonicus]